MIAYRAILVKGVCGCFGKFHTIYTFCTVKSHPCGRINHKEH